MVDLEGLEPSASWLQSISPPCSQRVAKVGMILTDLPLLHFSDGYRVLSACAAGVLCHSAQDFHRLILPTTGISLQEGNYTNYRGRCI